MALAGIKVERAENGRTKKVIINADSKSELVEDLLDIIAYEDAKAADDGLRYDWEEVKAELDKKHGWNKK